VLLQKMYPWRSKSLMRSAGSNLVMQRAIFIVRCILAVTLWHEFPTSELKSIWNS